MKDWYDHHTGFMTGYSFNPFALKRIEKKIQDPVWEATKKTLHQDDIQSDDYRISRTSSFGQLNYILSSTSIPAK
jgi:hypothetical protein